MATYILLLQLNGDGRSLALDDPESLLRAQHETAVDGVSCLGLYAVLGDYDFVGIVEAPDNDAAARFSLEFGVRAGAHIATLPAVPIGLLEPPHGDRDRPHADAVAPPRAQPPSDN